MTQDMYQMNETPDDAGDAQHAPKPSRRGQNLSLADRARGGHNSAKQQRRDRTGRFAGSTKKSAKQASIRETTGEREAA